MGIKETTELQDFYSNINVDFLTNDKTIKTIKL